MQEFMHTYKYSNSWKNESSFFDGRRLRHCHFAAEKPWGVSTQEKRSRIWAGSGGSFLVKIILDK
jgi:hypothetical protein